MLTDQESQSSRKFNPSDYPHTYVATTGNKIAGVFICMLLGGLCAFVLTLAFANSGGDGFGDTLLKVVPAMPMIVFGLLAWSTFRFKIVLRVDGIECQGLFSSWSMRRDQISGWRMRVNRNASSMVLTSVAPGPKTRKFSLQFSPDEAFHAWFADLPNADVLELKASEEEIRQNLALGNTPEERLQAAARARKFGGAFKVVAFVMPLWAMVYPQPHHLPVWICIAMPWMAVAACMLGNGVYTLGELGKKSAKADLTLVLFAAAIGLFMAAIQGPHVMQWTQALLPGLAVGVGLSILIGASNNWFGKNVARGFPYAVYCAVYAVAAIVMMNTLLDDSAAANYPAKILGHHQVHGKSVTSYLTLAAWGPRTMSDDVVVSRTLYDRAAVGDFVCVHLHDGTFHMPWYSIDECAQQELPVR